VVINNTAHFTYNLNVKNNENGLKNGMSEITGLTMHSTLSSSTGAPGINIYSVEGSFKIPKFKGAGFEKLGYPNLGKAGRTVATGKATLNISLKEYRVLSNDYSLPNPIPNIQMRTTATYHSQYDNSDDNVFTTFKLLNFQ